jgi:hypothetical protein
MPHTTEPPLDELLERHRAFWTQGQVDEPLLRIDQGDDIIYPLRTTRLPPTGRAITVDDLHFDDFWPRYDSAQLVPAGSSVFTFAFPFVGFPWIEAMLGCSVEVTSDRANIWARPFTDPDWDWLLSMEVKEDNPWLQKLLGFVDEMVARSEGRYLVTPGHQGGLPHGPSDVLAAMFGNEAMSYQLYDNPEKVEKFLLKMADICIRVIQNVLDHIPPYHGGYLGGYGVWAPGTAPVWIEDALLFFSPRNYRRFLKPCDEKAFVAFDYPCMHVHSGGAQVLDDLLAMDDLKAIQLAWDSSGPPLEELLVMCKRIQEQKPLVLAGRFSAEEQKKTLTELSPNGLCFLPRTA